MSVAASRSRKTYAGSDSFYCLSGLCYPSYAWCYSDASYSLRGSGSVYYGLYSHSTETFYGARCRFIAWSTCRRVWSWCGGSRIVWCNSRHLPAYSSFYGSGSISCE